MRTAPCVAELSSMGSESAACGGTVVAESVVLLAYPLGPIPLAARGLVAVLARTGSRAGLSWWATW
jgi:hypothetical protein